MLVKPVYFSLRHKHKHKHKHNGKHIFLGMRRMKNYYIIGSIPPRYRKEWRTMIVLMLSAASCHLKNHKYKHKTNNQFCSACAYACVVGVLTTFFYYLFIHLFFFIAKHIITYIALLYLQQ